MDISVCARRTCTCIETEVYLYFGIEQWFMLNSFRESSNINKKKSLDDSKSDDFKENLLDELDKVHVKLEQRMEDFLKQLPVNAKSSRSRHGGK